MSPHNTELITEAEEGPIIYIFNAVILKDSVDPKLLLADDNKDCLIVIKNG